MRNERAVLEQLAAALEAAGAALRELAQREPPATVQSPLTTHSPSPAPLVLTPLEAAERLKLSPRSLARLEESGELLPLRRGRYVRYPAAALDDYIARQRAAERK